MVSTFIEIPAPREPCFKVMPMGFVYLYFWPRSSGGRWWSCSRWHGLTDHTSCLSSFTIMFAPTVKPTKKIVGLNKTFASCAITLNYWTYTNHVGVSPRALYCVVDTSYGLGRSLGHCRPALPKGRKYQMVKTQTQSHDRRPVV